MDGDKLLPYSSQLLQVLQLSLHLRCKQGYALACNLLHHILRSSALIYPTEYCSIPGGFQPLSHSYLPIKVQTYTHTHALYLPIKVHTYTHTHCTCPSRYIFAHPFLWQQATLKILFFYVTLAVSCFTNCFVCVSRTGAVQETCGTCRSSGMSRVWRRRPLSSTFWTSACSQSGSGCRDTPKGTWT